MCCLFFMTALVISNNLFFSTCFSLSKHLTSLGCFKSQAQDVRQSIFAELDMPYGRDQEKEDGLNQTLSAYAYNKRSYQHSLRVQGLLALFFLHEYRWGMMFFPPWLSWLPIVSFSALVCSLAPHSAVLHYSKWRSFSFRRLCFFCLFVFVLAQALVSTHVWGVEFEHYFSHGGEKACQRHRVGWQTCCIESDNIPHWTYPETEQWSHSCTVWLWLLESM